MNALNARIGRRLPSPLWLPPAASAATAVHGGRGHAVTVFARRHRATTLIALLAAALWPHWNYVARRMVDGSDEPWGVVALATVAVLLWRDRAAFELPPRSALVAGALLATIAAIASLTLPDLAAAALAMLALGVVLVHALRRPAAALIALLLLALPIVASLQFYVGYPLRVAAAWGAAQLLGVFGLDVAPAGASLLWNGRTVLVDAPCAGIGMLWVGSYTAALLSYLNRADARRTAINAVAAGVVVLLANMLRNALLFLPEARVVDWPAAAHGALGLAAFAAAIVPIVFITCWRTR